ncbi:MAG: hypothetical protein Q9222_006924 [Ikaeria aurantiellina]
MDGVSIAASLVGIGAAGCQIAIKLYTLATQISTAPDRITSISNDVSLTAGVLQQLGELMTQKATHDGTSIFSPGGLKTTKDSALMCERIFKDIEQAAKEASQQIRGRGTSIGGKLKLSKTERMKWPFLQPSIETLRIDLREAKGNLMLMLQREIIAAILAIQRQQQQRPPESSRISSPVDRTNNSTPKRVPPIGSSERSISLDEESTLAPTPLSSSLASLPIRPNVLMALPNPGTHAFVAPENKVPNNCRNGCEPDKISVERLQEGCNTRQIPTQHRSSYQNQGMLPIQARNDEGNQKGVLLDLFFMKPVIEDIEDTIQLSWKIHKVQMQQTEIQNQISHHEREGLPPVFEVYQNLYAHEYKAIEDKMSEHRIHRSLVALKRFHVDMRHREILFQGIPGLQFILQQGERRSHSSQSTQDHAPISTVDADDTQRLHKKPKTGKKLAIGDFLNESSLGSWADEMDDVPVQAQEANPKEVPTSKKRTEDLPSSFWDHELADMAAPDKDRYEPGLLRDNTVTRDNRGRDENLPHKTQVSQVPGRTLRRKKPMGLYLTTPSAPSSEASKKKLKPAALKLETSRPVKPVKPDSFLTSLQNAQPAFSYKIVYPMGITPPRPGAENEAHNCIIRYDISFLLQFQTIVLLTPAIADIEQVVCGPNEVAVEAQLRRYPEHHIEPLDQGVKRTRQMNSQFGSPKSYGNQTPHFHKPDHLSREPQSPVPVRTPADIFRERRDREARKKAEADRRERPIDLKLLQQGAQLARDEQSGDPTTNIPRSVQEEPDVDFFKSSRVPMDESCSRTLMRLVGRYSLPGEWHEYGLYILHGDQERRVYLGEKPLVLFRELEQEGKQPAFDLRKRDATTAAKRLSTARKRTKTGCLTVKRDRSSPPSPTEPESYNEHDTGDTPVGIKTTAEVASEKHDGWGKYLHCDRIAGDVDMDALCSQLRAQAKSSGKGTVIDEQDVDAIWNTAKISAKGVSKVPAEQPAKTADHEDQDGTEEVVDDFGRMLIGSSGLSNDRTDFNDDWFNHAFPPTMKKGWERPTTEEDKEEEAEDANGTMDTQDLALGRPSEPLYRYSRTEDDDSLAAPLTHRHDSYDGPPGGFKDAAGIVDADATRGIREREGLVRSSSPRRPEILQLGACGLPDDGDAGDVGEGVQVAVPTALQDEGDGDEEDDEEGEDEEEEAEGEAWDTEEAERIVKELLGKYTTLFDTQAGRVPPGRSALI